MLQGENYKGLTFIRISKLPSDQRDLVLHTIDHQKIFKLLKDKQLMVDCLQFHHYQDWYARVYKSAFSQRILKEAKESVITPI